MVMSLNTIVRINMGLWGKGAVSKSELGPPKALSQTCFQEVIGFLKNCPISEIVDDER